MDLTEERKAALREKLAAEEEGREDLTWRDGLAAAEWAYIDSIEADRVQSLYREVALLEAVQHQEQREQEQTAPGSGDGDSLAAHALKLFSMWEQERPGEPASDAWREKLSPAEKEAVLEWDRLLAIGIIPTKEGRA